MEMERISIIFGVLVATWGGMFNLMKIVEMKNGIRNLVLDIDLVGRAISKANKNLLLKYDYVPLAVGIFIFLTLFATCLGSLPLVFAARGIWPYCWGAAVFAVFASIVDLVCGILEGLKMWRYIDGLP